ncbi:hypothetical protein [Actinomadura hibisca]|uniref:hypothetical protein n=1 Tax=Actinomadura hibisca TaxID=68565 RepID=UPI00082B0515|nr:hypothetical protein [Actinomadura hibisca]
MAGSNLPDVVERFVADVGSYVQDLERAARQADHFGEQNADAREAAQRMGHAAQEAGERAARSQRRAAEEARKLAAGQGNAARAAQAAAEAQRDLERAQMAASRAARAQARAVDQEAEQYRELAREAAKAAAAQRLAQLRASGDIEQHNLLIARLRQQFGDLGDDGDDSFREIERAARFSFGSIKDKAAAGLGGIGPMLLALPVLATVAGGATVLAIGGALAAVGLAVAAKNQEIKREFSGLKKHVVSEAKQWAKPFEGTLREVVRVGRQTFDAFGPTVRDSFRELAPAVQLFVGEFARALLRLRPVLTSFTRSFQGVIMHLGPAMDVVLKNVADGLISISEAVQRNPQEFANFLKDISAIVRVAGMLAGVLMDLYPVINVFSGSWSDVTDALGPVIPVITEIGRMLLVYLAGPIGMVVDGVSRFVDVSKLWKKESSDVAAAAGSVAASVQQRLVPAVGSASGELSTNQQLMQLARKSAEQLKQALDSLTGKTLTSREAAAQYGQAVIDLTKTIKENGKAHGFNSAKGIENEQALTSMAKAAHQNAIAMRDNGRSANDVGKFMASARKKIIDAAVSMGYSKREAKDLANKLMGVKHSADKIPPKKNVKVTAQTSSAEAQIRSFAQRIGGILAGVGGIVLGTRGHAQGGLVGYAGGGPVGYPGGGYVRGPGTTTSDSILARLSNKEFVINAASTRVYRPVLEAINAAKGRAVELKKAGWGTATGPGPVGWEKATSGPKLTPATGQFPTPPRKTYAPLARQPAAATVNRVENHFHVAGSVWAAGELLDVVQRQAAQRNVRNPGLAQFGGR